MNYIDFFNTVNELEGCNDLNLKLLELLKKIQPDVSDSVLIIFCIYFSLMQDGNTCICLDEKNLLNKWNERWNSLVLSNAIEGQKQKFENFSSCFNSIINEGCREIKNKKCIYLIAENESENTENNTKPFIVKEINGSVWLFTLKYYTAKIIIESKVKELFIHHDAEDNKENLISQRKELQEFFNHETEKGIVLNDEQLDTIIRGQNENLMITGGPGTGKTTVVCYLLWKLLQNDSYKDYSLYLAAPSGKARDRMKESILETLSLFKNKNCDAYKKLENSHAYTIHTMLNYNPGTAGFNINSENQFSDKSIFVIDEASMIDISLFSNLLCAIPSGARIFILGDKDQLPSVQAGAVLGELLNRKTDSVIQLTKSNRFNCQSAAGKLSIAIQGSEDDFKSLLNFTPMDSWLDSNTFSVELKSGENPVTMLDADCTCLNGYNEKDLMKKLTDKWCEAFYDRLSAGNSVIAKDMDKNIDVSKLEELWDLSLKARFICAERKGNRGSVHINNLVKSRIRKLINASDFDDSYFPGQLLMITENQKVFDLSNGDCGIVVSFNGDSMKYLMLKKSSEGVQEKNNDRTGIFHIGAFIFFPVYLLPSQSIDSCYAITVHKSQGSGYDNICIILPRQKGHPLLNRQILYTAVTRTHGSTYIVSSEDAVVEAKNSVIIRDTQINVL